MTKMTSEFPASPSSISATKETGTSQASTGRGTGARPSEASAPQPGQTVALAGAHQDALGADVATARMASPTSSPRPPAGLRPGGDLPRRCLLGTRPRSLGRVSAAGRQTRRATPPGRAASLLPTQPRPLYTLRPLVPASSPLPQPLATPSPARAPSTHVHSHLLPLSLSLHSLAPEPWRGQAGGGARGTRGEGRGEAVWRLLWALEGEPNQGVETLRTGKRRGQNRDQRRRPVSLLRGWGSGWVGPGWQGGRPPSEAGRRGTGEPRKAQSRAGPPGNWLLEDTRSFSYIFFSR